MFLLPVTCPTCAGPVLLVNSHSNGLLSVAILECPTCEREWEVTSRIVPHGISRSRAERNEAAKRDRKRADRELVRT